jgi:excisionase family DNA binding protein
MVNPVLLSRLMPLPKVAEALGVSVFTVRRLVNTRQLASVRVGARVLVNSAEVERVQREGVGPYREQK